MRIHNNCKMFYLSVSTFHTSRQIVNNSKLFGCSVEYIWILNIQFCEILSKFKLKETLLKKCLQWMTVMLSLKETAIVDV